MKNLFDDSILTPIKFTFFISLIVISCTPLKQLSLTSGNTIIHSTHDKRPDWTFKSVIPGDEHEFLYFIGISEYNPTENKARNNALLNAQQKVASYVGEKSLNDVNSNYADRLADKVVQQYEPNRWYLKKVRRGNSNTSDKPIQWKAIVQIVVPRTIIQETLKQNKKLEKSNNLTVPGGNISSTKFVSNNNNAREFNTKIKKLLTSNSNLSNLVTSPDHNTEYITLDSRVDVNSDGTMPGGMKSFSVSYTLEVSLNRPNQVDILLRTFNDQKSVMGSSLDSAVQRASNKIIEDIKPELLKLLNSTI